MTEYTALIVFASAWWLLFVAAVSAYAFSVGAILKRRASGITNALIVTPFVLVFSLFLLGRHFGNFGGSPLIRGIGALATALGLTLYLASHFFLRRNWSLSASIREGHRLVTTGPYRFVRHPMYTSMIVIVLGSGMLTDNYLMIASTLVVGLVYLARARKEEELLASEFPEFAEYASRVGMFVPRVF